MKTVAVIGGGASGIMAALSAAEDRENRVILIERQARIGKKLLATGNGRCNLTNTLACPESYSSGTGGFAAPALEKFPPLSAIGYFRSLGLMTSEQYGGRVYPLSDSAASVLDVLRFALDAAGVELIAGEEVRSAAKSRAGFTVFTPSRAVECDALIIACGGKAGGKLGGVSCGYELLKSFGHSCTKLYPALVPILTDTDYPRSLKGVRAPAGIELCRGERILARSRGELQFTETGVSGPAAFDVSREAAVEGGSLVISFLPDCTEEEIASMLLNRQRLSPALDAGSIFAGMLHSRVGLAVVKSCGIRPSAEAGSLNAGEIRSLSRAVNSFRLQVRGTAGFDAAQVSVGGIDTAEFRPDTLESRLVRGLFACGEVLDVDAPCGGYNLQWAWSSGRLAGRLGA